MEHKIQYAFDGVTADQALKNRTMLALKHRRPLRRPVPAVAALMCLVLMLGGCGLYFTPTATVSLDHRASLELRLNCFDRVLEASGCNDEGAALLSRVEVSHLPYSEAISALVEEAQEVTVTVTGAGEAQSQRLLEEAENLPNADCHSVTRQEQETAHSLGLSCGKYRAYLELKALDPSVTAQQVRDMTMAQLRQLIASLQETPTGTEPADSREPEDPTAPPEETVPSPSGQGNGNGNGHGNGQGHGHGYGKG